MKHVSSSYAGIIWATRGRHWGFRFLLDAGLSDPLPMYEQAFFGLASSASTVGHHGPVTALRFPDPEGRRDSARRVIPHEFVLFGGLAKSVDSVETGERLVWPLVSETYARIWDAAKAPTREEVADIR